MALAPEPVDPSDANLPLDWLARASDLLQGAFESAPVGLFVADLHGAIRWCNGTWRDQFDIWGPVPVRDELWFHRIDDVGRSELTRDLAQLASHGIPLDRSVLQNATDTRLRIVAQLAVPDEPTSGIVGAVMATEEQRSGVDTRSDATADAAAAWAHRAMHDPLTNLPNRLMLSDHLDKALARCERDQSQVALLFFDVDRFKGINDTQGHEAGDVLLRQLADRLTGILRPSDTVARLGGDEFVVLLDHVEDDRDALNGGRRVTDAIEKTPFRLPDVDLQVTVSAGIALSRPGISQQTLMREADAAMYRAKEKGRARLEMYDQVLRQRAERRVSLYHRLHAAIEDDAIAVHFQPCADLRSGRVISVEALARWPEFEDAKGEFIDVAVDSGLIVPLGQVVMRKACEEASRWHAATPHGPRVHVNLSSRQLQSPGMVDTVVDVLDATGLPPQALCLEMPEPALTIDPLASGQVLAELKRLGVLLAIDDFGTASSSLPHLRDLEIDFIKVDRSFVAGLGTYPADAAIVSAIVSITHSLGMEAVAEGVETVEQVAELQALGCDVAQGFLFSRPVDSRGIVPFLDHVFAV